VIAADRRDPAVSVVLPVWNAERSLASAIDSVLAQTFTDFELLIVDDGSSDGSGALIRRYRDRRIALIENEKNLGVARSLNLGIARARGRYLARMDADDLSAPERLERQVAFLDAHPAIALVATWARRIDARGVQIGVFAAPTDDPTLRCRLRVANCIVHGSVMMRSDVVRALGGYDAAMERAEDYDLWLRLSERHAIAALPELLYDWREHAAAVGHRHFHEMIGMAETARLAARRRFASALVGELLAGAVSAERAAQRALEHVREEHAARPPANRAAALAAAVARRAPRLHAHWFTVRHARTLARLRRVLVECAVGSRSRDATCAALCACLAPSREARGAPIR
jgi:hypothetical protein